jgi:hypothetical protein
MSEEFIEHLDAWVERQGDRLEKPIKPSREAIEATEREHPNLVQRADGGDKTAAAEIWRLATAQELLIRWRADRAESN